jgi:hypothetical protein
MDFKKFLEDFATAINGQYSEYDDSKSVIVVPLKDERYQAVVATKFINEKYHKEVVEFTSKVCSINEKINYVQLLKETESFIHAKLIIGEDDFLKVASSTFLDVSTPELLKEIIIEVAYVADDWELIITGADVN